MSFQGCTRLWDADVRCTTKPSVGGRHGGSLSRDGEQDPNAVCPTECLRWPSSTDVQPRHRGHPVPYSLIVQKPITLNFSLTQVIRRSLVPVPKVSAKATAQAELNQECSKGGKDKGKGKEPGQRQALGPCRHGAQPEGQQGQEGHGHGQGQGQGPRAQGQRPALGPYRHGAQPGGQQGQGEQLEAVRKVTTETLASGVQV